MAGIEPPTADAGIGVGTSRSERAIFLYLSFEHSFIKGK